jgi:GAF domain-containing protein
VRTIRKGRAADAGSPSRALAAVGARVVSTARGLFRVQRAALFWREGRSRTLLCIASASAGGGGEGWVGERLPAGVGMAGRAIREGQPVWSADLLADPRVPMAGWLRARMTRETLHAVAAAPLRARGAVLGAFGILDGAGRSYGAEDLRLLGSFAELAGEALRAAVAPKRARTRPQTRRRRSRT